jgi:hypothetical protein
MGFTAALPSVSSANPSQGAVVTRSPVDLQDKLARCVRQLGDWNACPSRKTPEGKQIIEDLQTQIRSIESTIKSADTAEQAKRSDLIPVQRQANAANDSRSTRLYTIGSLVNAFA